MGLIIHEERTSGILDDRQRPRASRGVLFQGEPDDAYGEEPDVFERIERANQKSRARSTQMQVSTQKLDECLKGSEYYEAARAAEEHLKKATQLLKKTNEFSHYADTMARVALHYRQLLGRLMEIETAVVGGIAGAETVRREGYAPLSLVSTILNIVEKVGKLGSELAKLPPVIELGKELARGFRGEFGRYYTRARETVKIVGGALPKDLRSMVRFGLASLVAVRHGTGALMVRLAPLAKMAGPYVGVTLLTVSAGDLLLKQTVKDYKKLLPIIRGEMKRMRQASEWCEIQSKLGRIAARYAHIDAGKHLLKARQLRKKADEIWHKCLPSMETP